MNKETLRKELIDLKAKNFELQAERVNDLLDAMCLHIGDLDQQLRDGLIYPSFYQLIELKRNVSKEKMRDLFDLMLTEDHLLKNIKVKDDTSVFTRSFSALVLNPILCVHEEDPFLSDEQMSRFRQVMLDYLDLEHDFRGFTDHGWAHAFAHWSDATFFMTFATDQADEMAIKTLDAIQKKYFEISSPLSREEDERLATNIVYTYVDEKVLTFDQFNTWLQKFDQILNIEDKMHKYSAKVNVKNLLRSMYFRMKHLNVDESFITSVAEMEKKFNNYYY